MAGRGLCEFAVGLNQSGQFMKYLESVGLNMFRSKSMNIDKLCLSQSSNGATIILS